MSDAFTSKPPPPKQSDAVTAKPPRPKQRSFLNQVVLGQGRPGELVVYSHSNLFYWWPVWLTAFLLAGITAWQNHRMAVVPAGTKAAKHRMVALDQENSKSEKRDVLILEPNAKLATRLDAEGEEVVVQPRIFMHESRGLGVLFVVVLLAITYLTNVPMRGLWSLLVVILVILVSIIFAAAGVWDRIFRTMSLLAIYINLGGYLTIGLALFGLWLVNFFFFDRQIYMIFTPGQVRMRLEMGGGETCYDTTGMVFHKQRSDLFRHWVLGFGSGDIVLRPAGGHQQIDLPNVLRVGRRVKEIERYLKEKAVVTS
jgi:hypothetical protein